MPNEILDRFRLKYPQYQGVDDSTLASGIVKKYPQYSEHLQDVLNPGSLPAERPIAREVPTQNYLGAARDIVAPWLNPQNVQKLQTGIRQAQEGSPITGGLNIANAAIQSAFTPISAISGQIEKIPLIGKPVTALAGAIPSALSAIGSGITNTITDNFRYGGYIPGMGLFPPPFKNERQAEEFRQASGEAGGNVAMFAAPVVSKPIGIGVENVASRLAGRAFGVGENYIRTQDLGRIAQQSGITFGKKALGRATGFANQLNTEINSKIIDPATQAGVLLDGNKAIDAMKGFKAELENRAVPDRASVVAVDRMISAAQERLTRTQTPGYLTPREAQDFKVTNNQILADVYSKLAGGANLTEKGTARKASLIEATDVYRKQLEDIHPELKGANWSEGTFLQLKNAIYNELNRNARGEGSPMGVVIRGGAGRAATASIYDLLKVKHIEARLAVVLGKIGRGLSGSPKNVKYGVDNPFQASPFNPPPFGNQPPPSTPTGGPPPFSTGDVMTKPETMLPHRTTFEQDLAFTNEHPQTARPIMEKHLGESSKTLSNEDLVRAYRSEPRTYLNEIPKNMLDQYAKEGLISKEAAEKAKSERGTVNTKMVEGLKTTPEDLVAYRKYISSGGNLNFSEWKLGKTTTKPIHEMTSSELYDYAQTLKHDEKSAAIEVFGPEKAKEYERAQRISNSSMRSANDPAVRAADAKIDEMESALTPEQQKRLFGIGESGPNYEDVRNMSRRVGYVEDVGSIQELADVLAKPLTELGDITDPAKMNGNQLEAYAMFKRAKDVIKQNGWSEKQAGEEIFKRAVNRFSDPEDAAFMLKRFFK